MQLLLHQVVTKRISKLIAAVSIVMLFLMQMGCTVKVVPGYDEKLFNDTEAFYKKADKMIEEGKAVSPLNDEERSKISDPSSHPGYISTFVPKYDELLLDADALILRAVANSQAIDSFGSKLNTKINDAIDKAIPSECPGLLAEVGKVDLTAMNFVDLKCTVLNWKEQHASDKVTQGKKILKKANWEGRKIVIFDIILAIQKAEGFKKTK